VCVFKKEEAGETKMDTHSLTQSQRERERERQREREREMSEIG